MKLRRWLSEKDAYCVNVSTRVYILRNHIELDTVPASCCELMETGELLRDLLASLPCVQVNRQQILLQME